MKYRMWLVVLLLLLTLPALSPAQHTPWFFWTLLPGAQMDEIIGEASGESAFNHAIEMGGYNRDRKAGEYSGTLFEAKYVLDKLEEYGLAGARIARFPGRKTWNGIKGELWEVSPVRQKLASFTDLPVMLASGSTNADVEAELIWVGEGRQRDLEGLDLNGKIVVTSAPAGQAHNLACLKGEALGVISFNSRWPLKDELSIPWSGIRGSGKNGARFAFYLPPREGHLLRDRLKSGQKIKVHALVEADEQQVELQNPVCNIPGTDQGAGGVIFSAHLFEGYTKQGANDNVSGCAAILEVARTLKTLIDQKRLPRPKRTIYFLWGPEYSGTGAWVKANGELMKKMLCNINLDMVGLRLSSGRSFMTIMRTTFGNAHYINDVMENYLRYVGQTNRSFVVNGFSQNFSRRIVAPSGSDDPMVYYMGTHMGSSDHEVFNDWAVGVPGVIMNTWPDLWFHTSGDRPDKMDPTQLKRVVVIAAAAAYTIAAADDSAAMRIASEISTNASRRMSHQLDRGLEEIARVDAEGLPAAYKKAVFYIDAVAINEKATLASVEELASDKKQVAAFIASMQASVDGQKKLSHRVLFSQVKSRVDELGVRVPRINLTAAEKKAARIIARPTEKITVNGYGGYRTAISKAKKTLKAEYRKRNFRRAASEVQLLVNGKNSALDIKKLLDTQFQNETELEDILTHLLILEEAGLVILK